MNKRKLLATLAATALALGSFCMPTAAAEPEVLVEESFDDYAPGHDGSTTLLDQHFIVDANTIGGGCVQVEEDEKTGNLFLFSHVFTQVYSKTSLANGYTFALDVFSTQGAQNCAVFVRAPQIEGFPYYESDKYADGQSACVGGLVFNFQYTTFSVNVKSFDETAVDHFGVKENFFTFNIPEGLSFNDGTAYTNFKVVDNGSEVKLYVEDTLVGSITLSGEKKGYKSDYFVDRSIQYVKTAVVRDAEGNELGTVEDTLVQSNEAVVGWATRAANMIVDNVYLAVAGASTDAPTDAPTDVPTNAPTDAPTDAPTEAPTSAPTDTDPIPGTEAPTDAPADGSTDAPAAGATEPAGKGCSATLGMGAVAALAMAAAAVALKKQH